MNRRGFLKVSGLISAALIVQFSPLLSMAKNRPVELVSDGVVFRGTQAGEIQTSRDAGRSWQLHTRLGSQYTITALFSDRAQRVHAKAAFAGRSFELVLAKDKKYWITV
jgi:hypothetical protein